MANLLRNQTNHDKVFFLFSTIYVGPRTAQDRWSCVSGSRMPWLVNLVRGHRSERRRMKTRFPLSALVVSLCLVAPLMASPIPIGSPAGSGYAMGSNIGLGLAELDMLSSSYKQAPSGFSVQGSMDNPRGPNLQESMDNPPPAAGPVGAIGRDGHADPGPNAVRAPVSEPSGLMVMLGSGLFGAGALLRRRLKA